MVVFIRELANTFYLTNSKASTSIPIVQNSSNMEIDIDTDIIREKLMSELQTLDSTYSFIFIFLSLFFLLLLLILLLLMDNEEAHDCSHMTYNMR